MKVVVSCLLLISLGVASWAEEASTSSPKAVSFQKWKKLQVVEAQNKVVRLSNLLLLLKSEKYMPENVLPQVAKESKQDIHLPEKQQQELVNQTETELKTAIASLEFAKELTLKDYFSVYLRQFKDNNEALEALAADMNKSEIAEILSSLISINSNNTNLENNSLGVVSRSPKSDKSLLKRSPSKL